MGLSVLRDGFLVPVRDFSYPIMLPGRYNAPGVLALGSGLAASA